MPLSEPRTRPFAQVDVFSATPFLGNPVAVVLDGQELPFAGHPTLGSAHAWLEDGGMPASAGRLVQECEAGLVTLLHRADALSFAAPPRVRTGPLDDAFLADIIAAFRIDPRQVLAHQWVDNGPGWAVVQLPTAADVLGLEPDLTGIPDAMVGAIGAYPAESEHAFEMRTFAPGVGVVEDPVCGSMNASVAQWLFETGALSGSYRVSQGSRVGRAGSILLDIDDAGTVWVGGATTTCISGTIKL